jgi:hypothetical protein
MNSDTLYVLGAAIIMVVIFLLGVLAGRSTAHSHSKQKAAKAAIKELAQALLEYYEKLPESQIKAHERELVRRLFMFFQQTASELYNHQDGFSAMTELFQELTKLIKARQDGRI